MQHLKRHEMNIKRKLLLVDDEFESRQLLDFIVSREYSVIHAENGKQALEILKENSDSVSLVLLDLHMPVMDGFELLTILHEDQHLNRIPVIVLTDKRDSELKGLELGAVDFITKPYSIPDIILARIKSALKYSEDEFIIRETETDQLTGLYTKAYFLHYAKQHDIYFPDMSMDAVVIEINRFQLLNELYGRAYGDRVMSCVGDMLKTLVLSIGSDALACRSESDRFELYIPHREDHDLLAYNCAELVYAELGNRRLDIRVGIYSNVCLEIPLEQRFDRAVIASNNIKKHRYSSYGFYDIETHAKELLTERLVLELDEAIAERQFIVYYQPKYDIRGKAPVLTSAEALVRWDHPEMGMVSPGLFVPAFEEHGLIPKLDRYVWRDVCEQIYNWKNKYGECIPVSLNVSRVDLFDPMLKSDLMDMLTEFQLKPDDISLEITESAYTDNSEVIIKAVNELRNSGFRIEMDDFGTGYSSLNMLASMPIDALKLDMRFVHNIRSSKKDYRLVKMVIDISKLLKIPVIAEGVEDEDQYHLLKKAGCDIIQGYYFSKPVKAEDLEIKFAEV